MIAHFVERQFGLNSPFPKKEKDGAPTASFIDRIYGEFRYRLEQQYTAAGIVKIDGAEEALDWLREHDIKMATTTGFYREVRDRILRELHWENRFDANVCSDDVANGRPAPEMIQLAMKRTGISDPLKVVNVGDTPLDLQAGTAAGCGMVIGVLSGKHTRERLEREAYTELLSSVADLPSLLE